MDMCQIYNIYIYIFSSLVTVKKHKLQATREVICLALHVAV